MFSSLQIRIICLCLLGVALICMTIYSITSSNKNNNKNNNKKQCTDDNCSKTSNRCVDNVCTPYDCETDDNCSKTSNRCVDNVCTTNSDANPSSSPPPSTDQHKHPTDHHKHPTDQHKHPTDQDKQPSEQPKQPSEQPKQPSEQPKQPSEQPKQPSEQPKQPSEQPKQPSEQPKKPSEQPKKPSEQPKKPSEQPKHPSEQPNNQQIEYCDQQNNKACLPGFWRCKYGPSISKISGCWQDIQEEKDKATRECNKDAVSICKTYSSTSPNNPTPNNPTPIPTYTQDPATQTTVSDCPDEFNTDCPLNYLRCKYHTFNGNKSGCWPPNNQKEKDNAISQCTKGSAGICKRH
jgi:hypothetical protein